ncbi:MAG: S8 family serine peptidase, partial [Bacteroidales bacterium]|nr:S8 family serine peptidase [Bacteroidales bacterium]
LLKGLNPKIERAFPQLQDTSITQLDNYYTVDLDNFDDTLEIMSLIENSGLVENVEFNEIYTLSPIEQTNAYGENEPKYNDTILNDLRISDQWAFNYMKINELVKLMRTLYPLKKARIFILDTGVDSKHEDLSGNYQSLSEEYDTDTGIHGTHCAGIAGSVSNNKKGIASLNFTGRFTSISSITVLPGGSGRQENIIDGIILACDNGADVISMSLGGPSSEKRQKAYEQAIKYANDKGAIVIVAAGNENVNARLAVPASCKGVITVSAVNHELSKAGFSNYVTDIEYKISAPGVNILSTIPGNEYKFLNGTSMATPLVAGLAGIMKAIQPDLTTEQIYNILTKTGMETRSTPETGKFIQPFEAIKSIEKKGLKAGALNYLGKISSFSAEAAGD